ncbi:MAG: thiamine phosphate synthase [Campylobacteraceae bacterium]|nr:thiamine phosphate synthase [Campylobacteraceae bacterium]
MIKKYLITDPQYFTSQPDFFISKLLYVTRIHQPDFICLRDKVTQDYHLLAQALKTIYTTFPQLKLYLHTDFLLASKLGFDGIHLPSHAMNDIIKAKALNLKVTISTHSLEEAQRAESLGADAITMSPIFATPNKGEPLGLEKLKEINDKISIKCFALGGIISDTQISACAKIGVYGVASIRYFLN